MGSDRSVRGKKLTASGDGEVGLLDCSLRGLERLKEECHSSWTLKGPPLTSFTSAALPFCLLQG